MRKKIFGLCALVLLGAAVLAWCLLWNAGFHNVKEANYAATVAPEQVVLTVGWNGDRDRVVTWRTRDSLSSCVLLQAEGKAVESRPATGRLVCTRGGRAYYYRCNLDSLQPGSYTYWVKSGEHQSEAFRFRVNPPDSLLRFALFGDIMQSSLPTPFSQFVVRHDLRKYDFMAYTGNVLSAPTDEAWQVWFRSMQGWQAQVVQLPTTGDCEYRMGLLRRQDPRWRAIFSVPQNGPERFQGSCYYVDYANLRMIYLNTEELQTPMDYHSARTWLGWVMNTSLAKWRIVVMHHPMYPAQKGHWRYFYRRCFRGLLQEADLVIAGHDRNYARRDALYTDAINGRETGDGIHSDAAARIHPSICIATVSCGSDYYEGKTYREDFCFMGKTPVYEDIVVTADSLHLYTRNLQTGSVVDELQLKH